MFLDTSDLLAYHDRLEPQHREARDLFNSAGRKLTTSYVLAEFVALADARGARRTPAIRFVSDLMDNPTVEVVWVGRTLHLDAMELLYDRLDKRWSLCDAVSFLVMTERGITESLTTDHHFEQAGFRRMLDG